MSEWCGVQQAAEILKTHDKFNILIHMSPDGDTIGSGFALCYSLRQMGKKANVVSYDEISKNFDFLISDYDDEDFEVETYISTDVADLQLLGDKKDFYKDKILLSIDHHATNKKFAKYLLLNSNASSACEIVLQVIKELGVNITKAIAECIYTGISTDTGCFKFSNTTPYTHRVAAELMEIGIDFDEINRVMFDTKTRNRIAMERLVLDEMEFHFDNRLAIIAITKEMYEKSGATDSEIEGITSLPRQIDGVKIGITIRERSQNDYKVSVRTYPPVDASAICVEFGGGGHNRAAGCTIKGTLEEVKAKLVKVCGLFLR